MGVRIETQELIRALEGVVKEAGDVLAVTADEAGAELSAIGNNAVRAAASDATNICTNLIARLGAHLPPAPVVEPEPPKPAEAMLDQLERKQTNLEQAITEAKAKPPAPPAEVAELIREGEAFGEAQDRLQAEYNELTNKIELGLATDNDRRKQSRLHGAIDWLRRKGVETV